MVFTGAILEQGAFKPEQMLFGFTSRKDAKAQRKLEILFELGVLRAFVRGIPGFGCGRATSLTNPNNGTTLIRN
jgi:hypothetical protein